MNRLQQAAERIADVFASFGYTKEYRTQLALKAMEGLRVRPELLVEIDPDSEIESTQDRPGGSRYTQIKLAQGETPLLVEPWVSVDLTLEFPDGGRFVGSYVVMAYQEPSPAGG